MKLNSKFEFKKKKKKIEKRSKTAGTAGFTPETAGLVNKPSDHLHSTIPSKLQRISLVFRAKTENRRFGG